MAKRMASFFTVAAFIILSCAGCGVVGVKYAKLAKSLINPFKTAVSISYNGIVSTAELEQKGGLHKLTFNSPGSVAGLCVEKNNGSITLSLGGVSFDISAPAFIPGLSILKLLETAISLAADAENESITALSDTLEIRGKTDAGSCVITLDKRTGALLKISIPESSFEAVFSNFVYIT